jgi:hypothetical protein
MFFMIFSLNKGKETTLRRLMGVLLVLTLSLLFISHFNSIFHVMGFNLHIKMMFELIYEEEY